MEALHAENEFLKSVLDSHYASLVSNLRIKSKQGLPVWIDVLTISLKDLKELDEDEEVLDMIQQSQNLKYKDEW